MFAGIVNCEMMNFQEMMNLQKCDILPGESFSCIEFHHGALTRPIISDIFEDSSVRTSDPTFEDDCAHLF